MCKCSLSLSLVHSEALSFVRCRRFANVSYLPINLRTGRRRTAAHLVLCASVSHFLSPPAAVLFTSAAAAILRLCSSSEWPPHLGSVFQGFVGGTPGGQGKSILLPPPMVCHHTHDHTCSARDTPERNQRTNTNAICQPSFFSSPSPSLLCSAGTWFQWFSSHSGVFQSFVTIFSYFHAQTYVHTYIHTCTCLRRNTPNTIKIIRGLSISLI